MSKDKESIFRALWVVLTRLGYVFFLKTRLFSLCPFLCGAVRDDQSL